MPQVPMMAGWLVQSGGPVLGSVESDAGHMAGGAADVGHLHTIHRVELHGDVRSGRTLGNFDSDDRDREVTELDARYDVVPIRPGPGIMGEDDESTGLGGSRRSREWRYPLAVESPYRPADRLQWRQHGIRSGQRCRQDPPPLGWKHPGIHPARTRYRIVGSLHVDR